jgi:hypothetical protein
MPGDSSVPVLSPGTTANKAVGIGGLSPQMKAIFSGTGCIRDKMNTMFIVTNPHRKLILTELLAQLCVDYQTPGVYKVSLEQKMCSSICEELHECCCSRCLCCSNCSEICSCPWAEADPDSKLGVLLGLVSGDYRSETKVLFK